MTWKVASEPSASTVPSNPSAGLTAGSHQIVYLDHAPGDTEIAGLEARGYRVLGLVPGNGVLVIPADDARSIAHDATGPIAPATLDSVGIQSVAGFDPTRKISPDIDLNSSDPFLKPFYVVEFHPDVDLNAARAVVLDEGLQLRDNPDLGPHRLLVRINVRRRSVRRVSNPLPLLALHDEVAYIFPASDALIRGIPTMACGGAMTEFGTIGQYIATVGDGWDGPGQGSATLGYYFAAMTTKLPAALAQSEIERAMAEWAKVAAVDWQQGFQAGALRTVSILFASGAHGDAYPFDGPGNTLAHTFYPAPPNPEPIAGDVHLDEDESWHVGTSTDLFSVVLHELGHALGLAHSDNPNDVMYPYYRITSTLSDGDRAAILRLYAPAGSTGPSTPQTPGPTNPTDPNPTGPSTPASPSNPTPPSNPEQPQQPTQPTDPGTPTSGGGSVTPNPGDTAIPTMTVLSPGSTSVSTSLAEITVEGTANDPSGIASVTWANLIHNGSASLTTASDGVTHWRATIPLLTGINRITIRATDGAGNTAFRSLVVHRY